MGFLKSENWERLKSHVWAEIPKSTAQKQFGPDFNWIAQQLKREKFVVEISPHASPFGNDFEN